MSVAADPSLAASTLGFSSLEQELLVDELALSGELPAWLSGSLLRTGPAKFEVGASACASASDNQHVAAASSGDAQPMRHWFDGLAMLHRFTIDQGRVSYGNRFLESRSYRAARAEGRIVYGEFATDPCRSLFKRVQTLFSPGADAQDEDDGVLLSVVLDASAGTSFLLVLDARDLSELARAEAPHHIPFGFHGQFAHGQVA